MKKLFIFTFSLFAMFGCAAIEQEPVYYNLKDLQMENKLYYYQNKPVTGIIIEDSSDTYTTMAVKDGMLDGPSIFRRNNSETVYTFKKGVQISAARHENNRLSWETFYKDNEEYKTVSYNYNAGELVSVITQTGNEILTQIYKDGKIHSEKVEYIDD